MTYRMLNIAAGLEIGICLLLAVFLLLIMLGNFNSPLAPEDIVLDVSFALNTTLHFPSIPKKVLFDIRSSQCAVGNIYEFYQCGIQKHCAGTLSFRDKSVKLVSVPNCAYTGFVRFQFGNKKKESVYK
jgi:hypothetical protein